MVSSLPPEVLVFCLVVGWKTTLALILVASLTYIMPALYKYVMRLWQPKSGYTDYGGSLWFWTVSLASAGAIWAAERANHPTVAAVLALGMIVMFLYMDQTNVHMSLEFISKGETPEGVALENDEGRHLPELRKCSVKCPINVRKRKGCVFRAKLIELCEKLCVVGAVTNC